MSGNQAQLPQPLGTLDIAAAQEALSKAEWDLAALRADMAEIGMTDAAFAAAVARIVVPLERFTREVTGRG
jgi:hypothetical protein